MTIKNNLFEIKNEINQLKEQFNINQEIIICAATKYVGPSKIKELVAHGIHDIGENRVEALIDKQEELGRDFARWHFIGTLQSRKVKEVINRIDYLHSLDRTSLASEIEKQRKSPLNCFVQVNASFEESKHGLKPTEVLDFIQSLKRYDKIKIVGLMTMAEDTEDSETIHRTFRLLKQLQADIMKLHLPNVPCQLLSMGMSNDYPIAIEEGANIIRIGSKLFK
jgi:PLP dependent protein